MVHTNKVTLKNLAKTENYIQFRQTWNQYSRNWSVPKRLVKGKRFLYQRTNSHLLSRRKMDMHGHCGECVRL